MSVFAMNAAVRQLRGDVDRLNARLTDIEAGFTLLLEKLEERGIAVSPDFTPLSQTLLPFADAAKEPPDDNA